MKYFLHVFSAALVLSVRALGQEFDSFARYQDILDRKPFGDASTELSTQAPPPVAVQDNGAFAKKFKMVAIKLDKNGKMSVGFINQTGVNRSYYLEVGETSFDGIELVEADFGGESARLRTGSESGWIYMNSSPNKPPPDYIRGLPPSIMSRFTQAEIEKSMARERVSLIDARAKRRKEILDKGKPDYAAVLKAKTAASSRVDQEALETHLKEFQLDAIRNGAPPLPLPLTAEMDDQLVREGVLPAR